MLSFKQLATYEKVLGSRSELKVCNLCFLTETYFSIGFRIKMFHLFLDVCIEGSLCDPFLTGHQELRL